jgi:LPXTG-motif cell wall-anchored protein
MGRHAQKVGRKKPDYFLPLIGAIASLFSAASKANDKEIAKKIGGMSEEAANRLYSNEAVTNALLDEMTPFKSSNTFYIILGVALVLAIIIGIILYKRK